MSDALKALLGTNTDVKATVHMKRLGTDFTVKAIDGDTVSRIQEQCTHYSGKGNKRTKHVDENAFGMLIVAEGCVDPDFSNAELMRKYGASDPGDCVKKALLAGEIARLSGKILDISGFEDEDEDEVKN
ncbi:hypothetical protein M655_024800 [Brevibacillus sp. NSP2.1]|uniref:phage tail assembly chaperone n=1 Tax=Brevibacillus sp. NSP2.1 TaxID=3003229 RepID=UPI00047B5BBD|nr:hypothetical protein [Brevibacillus sp. NSP2.1]QHZ58594.1 hypothetical protein M655_024800 [Brevibacillus sp. NSP2.1]